MKQRSILCLALLLGLVGFLFTTCKMPMGLGEPVDTTAPTIVILTPQDSQPLPEVIKGDPVLLSGTFWDDTGVTEIQIIDVTAKSVFSRESGNLRYTINKDGTWNASLLFSESGKYRLAVTALDKFKNSGKAELNLTIDLVNPWVARKEIFRNRDGEITFRSEPKEIGDYTELIAFSDPLAYKTIKFDKIDEFQNEAFTLKIRIDSNFTEVAASRLYVLDETGKKLNEKDPLVPVNARDDIRNPEWDISREMLNNWKKQRDQEQGYYDKGPLYLSFEVWAWNATNWEGENQFGNAIMGGSHGEQRIGGICWYPESDYPHVYVQANEKGSGLISLEPNRENELEIEFYDDDRLSEIYAGLILKDDLDALRQSLGGLDEAQFLESLTKAGAEGEANRTAVKEHLENVNLFDAVDTSGTGGRRQTVRLSTGAVGEYRLLALVRDDKSLLGYKSELLDEEKWGVYPPLRVYVMSTNAPIIIVEEPGEENVFPTLTDGSKFSIEGYTLDQQGVDTVIIAWVPFGFGADDARDACIAAAADTSFTAGQSKVLANKIKVWKTIVGENEIFDLGGNGNEYFRNDFSQSFDILTDFIYNEKTENKYKLFGIYSKSLGINGAAEFKTFRLGEYTEKPVITVLNPGRDFQVHDTNKDLELYMRVSSEGDKGIGLKPESLKITDITKRDPITGDNPSPNYGFSDTDPDAGANEMKRLIRADRTLDPFTEGERRVYKFEAEDILGNQHYTERTVIMSNLPALQYITSSNGAGTYGIGEVLRFEAGFSLPVKVDKGTGDGPRLKLLFGDPDGTPAPEERYATYVETPSGNTVIFTYTVKAGDLAQKLYTPLKPIELPNGAAMDTTESNDGVEHKAHIEFSDHANSLQNKVAIGLDGIRPRITKVAFAQPADTARPYYNNGKTITLELTSSEPVQVSGTPRAFLDYGNPSLAAVALFSSTTRIDGTSTLYFTYTVDVGDDVEETQVSWKAPWIQTSENAVMTLSTQDTITDTAGNLIDFSLLPSDFSGANEHKTAFIDTKAPLVPVYTLYSADSETSPVLQGDSVIANKDIYIRVSGAQNATLWYSLEAGNNPSRLLPETFKPVPDADAANSDKTTYRPSMYRITAWQEDHAGNRSPRAAERSVTINSRAPELYEITCAQPDGTYTVGELMTFKLAFSGKLNVKPGASAKLTLKGDESADITITNQVEIPLTEASGSILTFNWTVPADTKIDMRNIKALKIEFPKLPGNGGYGIIDDYGNGFLGYASTVAEETPEWRPLADNINLARPGLAITTIRPYITAYSPHEPRGGDGAGNGGLIGADRTITLTFDRDVWPNSGKNITIRPWGEWALPPILTVDEMAALYNSPLFGVNKTDYQRRLYWVDAYGLPDLGTRNPSYQEARAAYNERDKYNYYVKNTNGVIDIGGRVRPDTSGKYVLAFKHDIYEGVDDLRAVFNAAQWKWQVISVTSGSVQVDPNNRKMVTITLPESLGEGRIWEVLLEEGAFRDEAGNDSVAIKESAEPGTGYRFWSAGTARPVIRVDKYSYGDNYHGVLDSFNRGDGNTIPKIDTRVRIDCETPGAEIRYDTIRTMYMPPAAENEAQGGVFGVSGSQYNTAAAFFGHANVPGNAPLNINHNTGYTNNSIGSGNDFGKTADDKPTYADSNGFFDGLLVPNERTIRGDILAADNGTISWGDLNGIGNGLTSGGNLSGQIYQSIAPTDEAVTYGTPAGQPFFYAGDAYGDTNDTVTNRYDKRLQTGRRDYVAAAAKKSAVNSGSFAGPALDVSLPNYEGVYKTTLLYREPANGMTWFMVEGFDTPTTPSIAGFPLQEFRIMSPTPPGTSDHEKLRYTYFTKRTYRMGNDVRTNFTDERSTFAQDKVNNNNYIWVSWEIVSDFYQKGRSRNRGSNNRLNRYHNYGAVLCTYGAVTYRYKQSFEPNYDSGCSY